jgi:DNA-binding MarR family transcriptional regulator
VEDRKAKVDSVDQGDLTAVGEALFRLVATAVRHSARDISLTATSTLGTLERTGPRRVTDLAAVEGITQPSMTTLVSSLERSQLVERRPDAADQRAVLVAITPSGIEYLRGLRRSGTENFVRLIEKLPPEDAACLISAAPALERLHDVDNEDRSR